MNVVRDAGIGFGLIWAVYKVLGPRVAKYLDTQIAKAELAEQSLKERLIREEQETARLRAEVLKLVRSEAALGIEAREATAGLAVARGEARIRELERDKALLELTLCQQGKTPEDGPRGDS